MTTPHDEGRPEVPAGQGAVPPVGEPRPEPRYGQYAPAGWQAPGSAAPVQPVPPGGPVPGAPVSGAPVPPAGQPVDAWGAGPWSGAPGAPGSAGYGQPGWQQPGQVPPGYGYPGGAYQAPYQQEAYRPGIIPLRPLSVWEIFDGAFRAIRANPKTMFGLTAGAVTIVVAISSVITWYIATVVANELNDVFSSLDPSLTGSSSADGMFISEQFGVAGSTFGSALTTPLISLATTVLTGLLILSVSRSVIGRTATIGEVLRGSAKRLFWVVGFALLSGLVAAIGVAVIVVATIAAAVAVDSAWSILIALIGIAAMLVLAVWFTVRTLLVAPAIMLEGGGFWSSIGRAWRLTRGSFWRFTGLYLLVNILVFIVSGLLSVPVSLIATLLFQDPMLTTFPSIALNGVTSILTLTLTTVFSAGIWALAYIDARMRREGLDVELARAAAAGDAAQ
jgi:hypothetical protein